MKLSAFESADYISAQNGNGVVTSVVEAGRRAEPTTLTFSVTDSREKKIKGKSRKRALGCVRGNKNAKGY